MSESGTDEPLAADSDVSPFDIATARTREPVWDILLAIAVGGALGGAARFALNSLWPTEPGGFPWSTFVENVTGAFLLGALIVFLVEVWRPSRYLRPFLGVGLLGGFTTFSAYTSETRALLDAGEVPLALVYVFATLAVGLLASWAGVTGATTWVERNTTVGRNP